MSDADNEDANAETNLLVNDDASVVVHKRIYKLFSKENAQYLWNDIVWVKALFGAFDGLIISYSTFKCYFDLACPPGVSSSEAMHEWMSSPLAFLGVLAEAAFIMTLSYIGNVYEEDDKNKMRAALAWLWPYLRDGFKGLKFAYKGVRSIIQMALLLGVDFQVAFLPVGVALGLIAAANRIWYRNQVTDPRKKYQKKNNTLLMVTQNLGMGSDYELCEMPKDLVDLGLRKIAIAINEKENVLEYKVYDPFKELQRGKIDLTNELLYQKRFDEKNQPIPLTFAHLKESYSDAIRFHIAQKGHISKPNEEFYRHTISADMGGCCLTVMSTWPNVDGSNIDLGPYDSGYIRVMGENNGSSGLLYAKRNKCCSLLLSEIPYDVSKISSDDFDVGYARVLNEKKGINQLYYFKKSTKTWLPLQGQDETLRQYDSEIYTTNIPRDLSAEDLKKISLLTKSKHTHTVTHTWKQLRIDAEKLDHYDAMITESCRARVVSSEPDTAEQKKVCDLNEILIIHVDGTYKIGSCDEFGDYQALSITDDEMLRLLSPYQSGSYIQTKDYQTINEFLASKGSSSRVTNGSMHALSVKQLKWITSLTKHKPQEKQFLPSSRLRMSSAFFGGLIDGLYTYMAAIGLVVLCPPLLGVMIACCSLFTLVCVINRCYEEYEFQQEFTRSRLNVEFVLLQKEIEDTLSKLEQLQVKSLSNHGAHHDEKHDLLLKLAKHLIPKHKEKKDELKSVAVLSYPRAVLSGLRSGLYFYSAICSVEFAVATFCAIAMTAFPPGWIIAGFVLGFLGFVISILHALYTKYQHVEKTEDKVNRVTVTLSAPSNSTKDQIVQLGDILFINTGKGIQVGYCIDNKNYRQKNVLDKEIIELVERFKTEGTITQSADLAKIEMFTKSQGIKKDPAYEDLWEYIKNYKLNQQEERILPAGKELDAIYKSMEFDSLAQKRAQEVLEWVRSFFSGLSKGQKAVDYLLNWCLEVDADGHYSATPWMIILGLVVSLVYAVEYAFKAFAKNWRGANDVPPPVRPNDPRRSSSLHADSLSDISQTLDLAQLSSKRPDYPSSPSSNLYGNFGMELCPELMKSSSIRSPKGSTPPMHYPSPVSRTSGSGVAVTPSPRKSSVARPLFPGNNFPTKLDWEQDPDGMLKNLRRQSLSSPALDELSTPVAPTPRAG